jgi:hypothetical protein
MDHNTEALLIGKDVPFKTIEKEFCRVARFAPFAVIEGGKIRDMGKSIPYAFLYLESPVLLEHKEYILGIVHRIDFSNLWEVFKVRGYDASIEEVIIAYDSSYETAKYRKTFKLFSSFMPKLHVYIFPRGHLEQCYDRSFKPDDIDTWFKPIAEWKPY